MVQKKIKRENNDVRQNENKRKRESPKIIEKENAFTKKKFE